MITFACVLHRFLTDRGRKQNSKQLAQAESPPRILLTCARDMSHKQGGSSPDSSPMSPATSAAARFSLSRETRRAAGSAPAAAATAAAAKLAAGPAANDGK